MIGFYDYTVILTYLGLLCSVFGIFQAMEGSFLPALFCLGLALLCDTLDGKVARRKPNRTRQETMFGIQIDSLCDVVSFGIFPAVICYCAGIQDGFSFIIIGYYCLCCVIRLAYFNTLGVDAEGGIQTEFHGLPVVSFASGLPAAWMLGLWLPEAMFLWLLRIMLLVMGTLYILDFKMKKPGVKNLIMLVLLFALPLCVLCLYS